MPDGEGKVIWSNNVRELDIWTKHSALAKGEKAQEMH